MFLSESPLLPGLELGIRETCEQLSLPCPPRARTRLTWERWEPPNHLRHHVQEHVDVDLALSLVVQEAGEVNFCDVDRRLPLFVLPDHRLTHSIVTFLQRSSAPAFSQLCSSLPPSSLYTHSAPPPHLTIPIFFSSNLPTIFLSPSCVPE